MMFSFQFSTMQNSNQFFKFTFSCCLTTLPREASSSQKDYLSCTCEETEGVRYSIKRLGTVNRTSVCRNGTRIKISIETHWSCLLCESFRGGDGHWLRGTRFGGVWEGSAEKIKFYFEKWEKTEEIKFKKHMMREIDVLWRQKEILYCVKVFCRTVINISKRRC